MSETRGARKSRPLAPCLLLCLALALGCAAEGTAPKGKIGAGEPTIWNELWDEVTAKPGADMEILRDSPVVQVVLADERTVYYFTKPLHPAHPGVVKRAVVERDGAVVIETEGWAAGSQEAFERWLEAFSGQDQTLKRRFGNSD